jgi:hypothetical protein
MFSMALPAQMDDSEKMRPISLGTIRTDWDRCYEHFFKNFSKKKGKFGTYACIFKCNFFLCRYTCAGLMAHILLYFFIYIPKVYSTKFVHRYSALAAWRSGHRIRLWNKKTRVRIPPGYNVFRES